jgi:CAF1 family ribonuclease
MQLQVGFAPQNALCLSPVSVLSAEDVPGLADVWCWFCAGFTAVLQAMRDSGAPAVGHNLALDLAYILEAFAGPLPPSWRDYKALAAAWFPGGIYDTKRLSAELPQVWAGIAGSQQLRKSACQGPSWAA